MSDNQLLLASAPINEIQNVEPQKKLSFWQLIGITIDFCGIFFAYSLQGVVIVPLFLSFGLTQAETSLVMLISPIAVIVVFPLIGVLSDNCTLKIGKRRPFIFLGLLLQVTGLTLLAVAPDIGYLLGDSLPPAYYYGETIPVQIYAIIIGLIGYSFVDFAAGVMQLPSRALLMDVTPIEQQTIGAALFAFWMSAGNAIGYLCGSVNWSQYSIFNTIFSSQACTGSCTNYRTLFVLAALLDFITVSITLFSIKEKQLKKENSDKKGFRNFFSELVKVFKGLWDYVANRMDARTTRVLLVYFVSWLSWPLWTFYISDWVGTEVYGGDPNAPEGNPSRTDYDDGVEMASFSLFLYSVVAFIYSIILPFIIKIKWLGYRSTWAGAMFFHAVIYFALIVIRNKIATGILISLAGVNLATMHVVPWALVGFATAPADNGAAFALVNVCNALPSLLLNGLINPGLEYLFSSLVPAMCFGGATMFIAALLVFFVKKPIVEKIE